MPSDHELIQNLYAAYCFAVDRGSAEDIAAHFWDDCYLNFGGNIHEGVGEARIGFAKWIARMREPVEGLRHCLYTPLIEVNGDLAEAEAYYDADGHAGRKGKPIQLRGLYRSTLKKRASTNGKSEWRFLKHEVQIWNSIRDHAAPAEQEAQV
ncbi:nuclear transport factor 2 family protein [Sphingorhabdus sp. EL138]|uniref:nuclear transport factor 2 family protein n=1 Tax=Sphingorhabdus sp. EL138 TaxID=2073156 RepID=UPI0013A55968|nr:nuclear transport factor 2 family protein [Sphingorhabdus sp. EL138]